MKKDLFEGLTEEQLAKIRECKNTEEILKVASEEGIELNDEQLEAVSGGCATQEVDCPICGGKGKYYTDPYFGRGACVCPKCGTTLL